MKGKALLAGSAISMIVVLMWQWVTLPDRVPSQLGFGGVVERWGGKTEYLVTLVGVTVLLVGLFGFMHLLVMKLPAAVINVPYKEYWLAPERREAFARRIGDDMPGLGGLTVLVILAGALETGYAATHGRRVAWDWVAFVGYLVVTMVWTVRLVTSSRYRPPDGWRPGSAPAPGGGRFGPQERGRI